MTEDTIEIGRREALAIRQSIARVGQRVLIRKAAVLGAGVMGAQIAAHLANANVKPILFDLPAKEGKDKSAIANKAIDGLAKLKPEPDRDRSGRRSRSSPPTTTSTWSCCATATS